MGLVCRLPMWATLTMPAPGAQHEEGQFRGSEPPFLPSCATPHTMESQAPGRTSNLVPAHGPPCPERDVELLPTASQHAVRGTAANLDFEGGAGGTAQEASLHTQVGSSTCLWSGIPAALVALCPCTSPLAPRVPRAAVAGNCCAITPLHPGDSDSPGRPLEGGFAPAIQGSGVANSRLQDWQGKGKGEVGVDLSGDVVWSPGEGVTGCPWDTEAWAGQALGNM